MTENAYVHDGINSLNLPVTATGPDPYKLPSLEEVLEEFHPFPAYSILLGLCEDGLPLILDLTDPSAGSFLIAGDEAQSNFDLLYGLLTSATLVNNAEEVNLHLISPLADNLVELHKQPAFKISFHPARPECEIVVEEIVNLVHQRQGTMEVQPIHVLAVDRLELLFQTLSHESKYWFNWLVENGPEVGLWVIATLESDKAMRLPNGTIDAFPSRILGHMQSQREASSLSGLGRTRLDDLIPGEQFYVRSVNGSHIMWLLQADK
jgi:hypothetical protein